jgi:hypothetical protein
MVYKQWLRFLNFIYVLCQVALQNVVGSIVRLIFEVASDLKMSSCSIVVLILLLLIKITFPSVRCRVHHYRRNHLPKISARLGVVGYYDNRQVVMMTVQIKEIG